VVAEQPVPAIRQRGPEDEDLDQLVEDDSVGDARSVAAEGVAGLAGRQEGGELDPERLDEA
jgi:hypothetical protein